MTCSKCIWIRWGRHANGRQRWRCNVCGKARIRQRKSRPHGLIKRFLLDGDTMVQLSREYQVHPLTIRNRLYRVLDQTPPISPQIVNQPCWLITDATHFKRWGCLLVTKANGVKQPLAVSFHPKECLETVLSHLQPLAGLSVNGYTTDGKKGLVMAHQQLFPQAGHQRCLVHIRMKVQTLLTCHPKVPGGRDLLQLSAQLTQIKSTDQAQDWWSQFCDWQESYQLVLNQRTHLRKSWWYTHRNLRYAWKHVLNAADSLFVFLAHPNSVSHTNHLEGLFGQRKPALVRHRGLSRRRVANVLLWTFYLLTREPRVS